MASVEALKRELKDLKDKRHEIHQREKGRGRHVYGGRGGGRGHESSFDRGENDGGRANKRHRASLDGDVNVNGDGDGGAPPPPGGYAHAPNVDTRPKDAPGLAKDEGEKRRGRRMFAGLLGTLKRHRDEEKAVAAVTAQRRSVIEQAETKARKVTDKLRQHDAASGAVQRARDRARTAEIDLKVAEKELEVKLADRVERTARYAGCARTSATCGRPRVFYKPKTHTSDTSAAVETAAKETEEEWNTTVANSEEKVERMRRTSEEATRELEEAEANAPEGASDDDMDADEARGKETGGETNGEKKKKMSDGDDREDNREGTPEDGELKDGEKSDGDEDMGDLEEGPDPEGLEDMLAGK
jgi:pinin